MEKDLAIFFSEPNHAKNDGWNIRVFYSPHLSCLMPEEISLCRLCCQLQPSLKTNKHMHHMAAIWALRFENK